MKVFCDFLGVIYKTFRGEMKQWSRKLPQTDVSLRKNRQ